MARNNVVDLTDKLIGCNKVLYRVPAPRGTNAWWRIKCVHCGREKNEMGSRLRLPKYQSCMCQGKKVRGMKDYEIREDGVYIKDTNGTVFIIDESDLSLVSKYTWLASVTTKGKTYVRCSYLKESLHRFLLDPPKDKVVDHINGNTLDNRRSNLRVCTHTENMQNQKLRTNNSTGVTGVSKCGKRYRAVIRVNKKDIHLGVYDTLDEAKKVRKEAEAKYFKLECFC